MVTGLWVGPNCTHHFRLQSRLLEIEGVLLYHKNWKTNTQCDGNDRNTKNNESANGHLLLLDLICSLTELEGYLFINTLELFC